MQKIEDEDISKKIRAKVNKMNVKMAVVGTLLSALYASIPFTQLLPK